MRIPDGKQKPKLDLFGSVTVRRVTWTLNEPDGKTGEAAVRFNVETLAGEISSLDGRCRILKPMVEELAIECPALGEPLRDAVDSGRVPPLDITLTREQVELFVTEWAAKISSLRVYGLPISYILTGKSTGTTEVINSTHQIFLPKSLLDDDDKRLVIRRKLIDFSGSSGLFSEKKRVEVSMGNRTRWRGD